ncbi:MAG: hypothetical protein H9W81_09920 [Enterococcus sp.]|nr:hypothetical protein [Enterococcus sp.]
MKNFNHYAFVICDDNRKPTPSGLLFFSSRTEAIEAFKTVENSQNKGAANPHARIYVYSSAVPVEFHHARSLAQMCMETNEWHRHGWKILSSTFSGDMILNEYTENLTNEEQRLVARIKTELSGMSKARAAMVMSAVTEGSFIDAKFEA